jgi:hypothetical protein
MLTTEESGAITTGVPDEDMDTRDLLKILITKIDGLGESFGAKIDGLGESLGAKIDGLGESLGTKIDGLGESLGAKIDGLGESLGAKIDGLGESLGTKIDALDDKITTGWKTTNTAWGKIDCPICLASKDNCSATTYCCKQAFHEKCLLKWARKRHSRHSCPMCRDSLLIGYVFRRGPRPSRRRGWMWWR